MISFSTEHYDKFLSASMSGTGYLAYRDIPEIIKEYEIDVSKILDLGCGSGRSTVFLKTLTKMVYASDIAEYAVNLIKKNITSKAFVNYLNDQYENIPYDSIFAFFTFLHLSTVDEIVNEYKRCHRSLKAEGHLLIVSAHENLFHKNYESVGCRNIEHFKEGAHLKLHLKKINCEVNNCYWRYSTLIELALEAGFELVCTHFPLGKDADEQPYLDEYLYPPYVYLVFQKK